MVQPWLVSSKESRFNFNIDSDQQPDCPDRSDQHHLHQRSMNAFNRKSKTKLKTKTKTKIKIKTLIALCVCFLCHLSRLPSTAPPLVIGTCCCYCCRWRWLVGTLLAIKLLRFDSFPSDRCESRFDSIRLILIQFSWNRHHHHHRQRHRYDSLTQAMQNLGICIKRCCSTLVRL